MNSDINNISNKLIPGSLDDIISKNRELVELRLANEKEINDLTRQIRSPVHVKDAIEDWRLVSLVEKTSNKAEVLLLGNSHDKTHPWITSPILTLDLSQGFVSTQSGSIYKLLDRGIGEPPASHIICLCAALHVWGSGQYLGVPHFYY